MIASIGIPKRALLAMKLPSAFPTEGMNFCVTALRCRITDKPLAPLPIEVGYSNGIPPTLLTHKRSGIAGHRSVPGDKQRSLAKPGEDTGQGVAPPGKGEGGEGVVGGAGADPKPGG